MVGVGGPGVGIGEPSGEELIDREAGRLPDAHENSRVGPFEVRLRERIGGLGKDFKPTEKIYIIYFIVFYW